MSGLKMRMTMKPVSYERQEDVRVLADGVPVECSWPDPSTLVADVPVGASIDIEGGLYVSEGSVTSFTPIADEERRTAV